MRWGLLGARNQFCGLHPNPEDGSRRAKAAAAGASKVAKLVSRNHRVDQLRSKSWV